MLDSSYFVYEDRPPLSNFRGPLQACCRNYLTDYVSAALAGQVTERDAIDRFMDTLRVIQMTQAQTLNLSFDLNLEKAIPARASLKDLSRLPRLAAFYDHQMKSRE